MHMDEGERGEEYKGITCTLGSNYRMLNLKCHEAYLYFFLKVWWFYQGIEDV